MKERHLGSARLPLRNDESYGGISFAYSSVHSYGASLHVFNDRIYLGPEPILRALLK